MATLKRTKSQRGDQPTLFGNSEPVVISGEPVVFKAKNESRAGVVGPVAKGDAARKGRSDLLGLDNKIPSKSDRDLDGRTVDRTDARTDGDLGSDAGRLEGRSSGAAGVAGAGGPKDSDPPSPIDSPRFYQSEQRDSHRPFTQIHRKRTADEVIRLEPDTPGYTPPAWRAYGRVAYVTKTLLVVVADCDAADVPDRILVRFEGEEYPSPTRECFRLTVNMFEMVLEKCVAAEKSWEAGVLADVDYRMLRTRFAVVAGVFDGLPKTIEVKGGDA